MSEKINADLKSLNFIFNKNKPYIFPIVIMLISIILFFQFVIPQFKTLLKVQKEVKESSLRLEILRKNVDVLTNVNEQILDSQLRILNLALPLNKDSIGILNSVYSTSQRTGVNLGSFSFKIGDLTQSENNDNFPVVKLVVPIDAGVTAINSFVETISKTFPLSEVYFVKVGNASSTIGLSFYYKPLGAPNYSRDVSISLISKKGLTLLNQLSEFGNTSFTSLSSMPTATSSATQ